MKKSYIFIFILVLFVGFNAKAQTCTPDPAHALTPGIFPDSATNFLPGTVNVPYVQNITVTVPVDTQVVPFPFPAVPFDSIHMVSMTGLPPGLSSMCSPGICTWNGGTSGCSGISGTPTTAGTYPLTIMVNAYLGGATTPIPQTISYYKIIIAPAVGIAENTVFTFDVKQNMPNPFSGKTTVRFTVPGEEKVKFCVYSMLGKIIMERKIDAAKGENEIDVDGKNLAGGMYFYTLEYKGKTVTRRMMVSNY
ncbi:MAG: T9SS type A sorting domain-containing protein [Bacteroidia bacterium]|nr:T9SS type A sorting domain-containing protein [Bacteroidia bacterium]